MEQENPIMCVCGQVCTCPNNLAEQYRLGYTLDDLLDFESNSSWLNKPWDCDCIRKRLALAQIATAIDTDGTICISISKNRYKKPDGSSGEPQCSFVVNIRQIHRGIDLINLAYETLGGSVQPPSKSAGSPMWTWQPTGIEDIRKILPLLRPYFKVKGKEADLMTEALNLWIDTPREKKNLKGAYSVPSWVKSRVFEISSQMNEGQQKETSRRNKEVREPILLPAFGLQESARV